MARKPRNREAKVVEKNNGDKSWYQAQRPQNRNANAVEEDGDDETPRPTLRPRNHKAGIIDEVGDGDGAGETRRQTLRPRLPKKPGDRHEIDPKVHRLKKLNENSYQPGRGQSRAQAKRNARVKLHNWPALSRPSRSMAKPLPKM